MSTISLCSKCGGAVVAEGHSYYGRRCTCSRGGSVATLSPSSSPAEAKGDPATSTVGGHKYCCKCGADVTQDRRMKDHLGRYWCYECGAADQAKKGQGVSMLCPDCKKHFRPTKMMKHGEEYVCEACHAERMKHKPLLALGRRRSEGSGGGGIGLLLLLLVVGAGVALIALYALDMLP